MCPRLDPHRHTGRQAWVLGLPACLALACSPDPLDWEFYVPGTATIWDQDDPLTVGAESVVEVTLRRWDGLFVAPKDLVIFADDEGALQVTVGATHQRSQGEGVDLFLVPTREGHNALQLVASNTDESGWFDISAER